MCEGPITAAEIREKEKAFDAKMEQWQKEADELLDEIYEPLIKLLKELAEKRK